MIIVLKNVKNVQTPAIYVTARMKVIAFIYRLMQPSQNSKIL